MHVVWRLGKENFIRAHGLCSGGCRSIRHLSDVAGKGVVKAKCVQEHSREWCDGSNKETTGETFALSC